MAAVCMAYWPHSSGNQGIAVSEGINGHQPGLTPFMCPGLKAVLPHRWHLGVREELASQCIVALVPRVPQPALTVSHGQAVLGGPWHVSGKCAAVTCLFRVDPLQGHGKTKNFAKNSKQDDFFLCSSFLCHPKASCGSCSIPVTTPSALLPQHSVRGTMNTYQAGEACRSWGTWSQPANPFLFLHDIAQLV